MKRKILSIILVICLLAGILPLSANAAASGTCGPNAVWDYDFNNKVLTVSGSGPMYDWDWDTEREEDTPPWSDKRLHILEIVVKDGITHIGDDAFAGCRYMTRITLPDSVTSVGNDAFYVCEELHWDFKLPQYLETIEKHAFYQCNSLTEIELPDTLSNIEDEAFYDCSALSTVTLSRNLYNRISPEKMFVKCPTITFKDKSDVSTIATLETVNPSTEPKPDPEDPDDEDPAEEPDPDEEESEEPTEPLPFVDVKAGEWYEKAVRYAYENGLFAGTSDTTFSPDTGMTRGMFVTVLGRKSGINTEDYLRYRFIDAKIGDWYTPYVEWAASYNIVSGVGPQKFEPNTRITREQMATILYRYAQKTGNDTTYTADRYNSFPDITQVSNYAEEAMQWATSKGILNGSNGKLNPKGTATRAQVAQVFMNCKDHLISTEVFGTEFIAPEPVFTPVPMNKLANYKSLSKGMTTAEFTQAYKAALEIVKPLAGYNKQSQLYNIAVQLRILDEEGITYSTTAPHYSDAYGYFIAKAASCAGCARATGLCLNILGYSYEHVNEGEWRHQWCRVRIGSEYWICDAYGLYCGPEPAPYKHPYLS